MRECLELHLLEMEMLFSMFPSKEDIVIKGVNSLSILRRYLEGTYESLPPSIEFSVFVKTEDLKVRIVHVYVGLFSCSWQGYAQKASGGIARLRGPAPWRASLKNMYFFKCIIHCNFTVYIYRG